VVTVEVTRRAGRLATDDDDVRPSASGGYRGPSESAPTCRDRATAPYEYICKSSYRPKFMCGLVHKGRCATWRMSNTEGNAGTGTRLDGLRAIGASLTGASDWRRPMKFIVDEAGEIIAQTTDDHTLIGGHHRLAVAASLGKRLFWRDTGEPVKLDHFFKHHGSSLRHTA
jgi:hypothetical protein